MVHLDKLRPFLIKTSLLLFLCCLLLFSASTLTGAQKGLLLWFNQVLPSLLPFLILSTLLLSTGLSDSLANRLTPLLSPIFRCSPAGCYAIVIGILSGLPVGAKTIASLVLSGKISKKEGQYLLPLCNNPSPLFLLGFISVSVLKQPSLRYPLFFIVTLSSILAAMLLRPHDTSDQENHCNNQPPYTHVTHKSDHHSVTTYHSASTKSTVTFSFLLLDSAIEQAFSILTRVGGYIILFSVLANLLTKLPLSAPSLACMGAFFEITTGCSALSALNLPVHLKTLLITGFVTFGGLSTAAQTKSVLAGTKFPFAHYLLTKAIAGCISCLLMAIYLFVILNIL